MEGLLKPCPLIKISNGCSQEHNVRRKRFFDVLITSDKCKGFFGNINLMLYQCCTLTFQVRPFLHLWIESYKSQVKVFWQCFYGFLGNICQESL